MFVGAGVNVGAIVGSASVAEGVIKNKVGVSVTGGVATGKLQASMAKMRTSAGNKTRGLIISPFLNGSYTGFMIPLRMGRLEIVPAMTLKVQERMRNSSAPVVPDQFTLSPDTGMWISRQIIGSNV